jgi:phage tail sheath gpL-like
MGLIQFNNMPPNTRAPFFYVELNAGGTPPDSLAKVLIMGQMLDTGLASENEIIQPRSTEAGQLFGANSMVAAMYKTAVANAPLLKPDVLPIKDDVAGTKATWPITISGAPVARQGTMSLWIAGKRSRIAIKTSDSDSDIATRLAEEINTHTGLPVATVDAEVITLTARHGGALSNSIEIDLGDITEEGPLGSQLITIGAVVPGSGDPDLAAAIAAIDSQIYDWIVVPYTDTVNLNHLQEFLSDETGRWGPTQQLYGHFTAVTAGTYGAQSTLGGARNDPHASIVGAYKYRSPSWEIAAAMGAREWFYLSDADQLSRPMHTIKLMGIMGPLKRSDEMDLSERNTLYYKGISCLKTQRDGSVVIDKLITTYQTNKWGDPDSTFLSINTIAQAMYGLPYFRQRISTRFGRAALYDDNPDESLIPPGAATPKRVQRYMVHVYTELCQLGVFENPDLFAKAVRVERDQINPNRLNAQANLDHVNQLDVFAMSAVSYLNSNMVTGQLAA